MLVRAFAQSNHLPVFECDKAVIARSGAQIRLPQNSKNEVRFNAWRFAHALRKADCLRTPPWINLSLGAAGFLLEHSNFFDWTHGELRLNADMSGYYADFARSSLAGRVGQAVSLLLLEELGYSYVGHLPTVLADANLGGTNLRGRIPDFVFESSNHERALVEAKGGFVKPRKSPAIKGALKDGLEQIAAASIYSGQLHAKKGFVVSTFLRERGDASNKPSLIAYVDPEGSEDNNAAEVPKDAVQRANYGAWLGLMQFSDAARRLRMREGLGAERRRYRFHKLRLGDQEYAVRVTSLWVPPEFALDTFLLDERILRMGLLLHPGTIAEVAGIDCHVLESISSALSNDKSDALLSLKPIDRKVQNEVADGAFNGSAFSDGSLIGQIEMSQLRGELEYEPIELEL